MTPPPAAKRLRLRRPDRCVVCGRELSAETEAMWDPASRTVTCLACGAEQAPVEVGVAGASARREYERRRRQREEYARQKLGRVGVLLARLIGDPQSTRAWAQGAEGEVRTGARLEKHLDGHPVRLLQDRRIPGHGHANIDHLAVGPGGITVIDSKTLAGKVRVRTVGGLFSPRRQVLMIAGRDQTRLVAGLEQQIEIVRAAVDGYLESAGADVRGALCFPHVDGLPVFRRQYIRGVLIDGPKRVAQLPRRPGTLGPEEVERIWRVLAQRFPQA